MKLQSELPTITKENGVLVVGFYNSGNGEYFMIQRSFEQNLQDEELKMNTYYLERNDQRFSCYGGIQNSLLSEGKLELEFSQEAKIKLLIEKIEITWIPHKGGDNALEKHLITALS